MAVAATRSDTLTLGISYQGSQTCFRADWKISRIALKLREMTDPYFVTINTALPTEQLLTFSQETTPDDEIKLLNMTIEAARTMALSVIIFQQDEGAEVRESQPDATVREPSRFQQMTHPIELEIGQEFEPNACYQIRVANENATLRARVVKVDKETSKAQSAEEVVEPIASNPIDSLEDLLAKIQAIETWHREALQETDPELDQRDIPKLEERYKVACDNYLKSGRNMRYLSSSTGFGRKFQGALTAYTANIELVIRLGKALIRKGATVQPPKTEIIGCAAQ